VDRDVSVEDANASATSEAPSSFWAEAVVADESSAPSAAATTAPVGATCPQPAVPYRAFAACVLADGLCVASRAECEALGGRFDRRGCGDGRLYLAAGQSSGQASCACCADLPTETPTQGPTVSPQPTRPYPRGTCAVERVPSLALKACLKDASGYCLSNERECDILGGVFDLGGCDAKAHCGCCTHVPSKPTSAPTSAAPAAVVPPPVDPSPTTPRALPAWWLQDDPPTDSRGTRDAREARPRGTSYFRTAGLVLLLAFATNICPQPANPLLRALLSPFVLLSLFLKSTALFLASFCFSFGEGIAEPRPPAPIPKPFARDIQMTDRRPRSDHTNAANATDSLLADAELEDYEFETDDEEGAADNPFKKRT